MTEHQYRQPQPYEDEISLVDLALVLIKRRWWVIGSGAVVFAVALTYALLMRGEPSYQMVTIYEPAQYIDEKGQEQPIQSTNNLIQRLQTVHWPELRRAYVAEHSDLDVMPFELDVSNPADTHLISMTTPAEESNQDEVEQIHRRLLAPIIDTQREKIENRQRQLQSQVVQLQNQMKTVEAAYFESDSAAQIYARLSDQLFGVESELESLGEGEVVKYAARGDAADGQSSALILALGLILGGMIGVMAAFLAEFGSRVRHAMKEEKGAA